MSERGISGELLVYADDEIETLRDKNSAVMDDIEKYRANAMRIQIWNEVKSKVTELRGKYLVEDDDL